jgi:hypothetical protein
MISTSASLCLAYALLGPPDQGPSERQTPVLTPTQPHRGEPAIGPAQSDGDRAVAEPEAQPLDPVEPPLEPEPAPEPGTELPSWEADPAPAPVGDPGSAPIADWTTPVESFAPPIAAPAPPPKGTALFGAAAGVFGLMVVTQLGTGVVCEADVYCGTLGWPWRMLGFTTVGLAGGGGWQLGKRIAWDRVQAGEPVKKPTGRRVAGWSMFALGVGGMIADTILYQQCYDGVRGPYLEIDGFRYTCSPNISVVTLDLTTLLGAVGLGLALSAESQQQHNRRAFDLSVSPWGGHGQAGMSVGGRF